LADEIFERREDNNVQFGKMIQSIDNLKNDINELKQSIKTESEKQEQKFVTKIEFAPVRNIVYGMIAMFCIGILTALLKVVITK